jgi:hypothetical protein
MFCGQNTVFRIQKRRKAFVQFDTGQNLIAGFYNPVAFVLGFFRTGAQKQTDQRKRNEAIRKTASDFALAMTDETFFI